MPPSTEHLRAACDKTAIGIEMLDFQGRYLSGNGMLSQWLGYTDSELEQLTFVDITDPQDLSAELHLVQQLLARQIPSYSIEKRYRRKDAQTLWVRVTSSIAWTTHPYRISIIEDITQRRQTEEALRESEERFAAFMRHLPGAAWIKDLAGRYVYANPEAERMFSRPLNELLGKTDEEVFPPETARQFRGNDIRVLSGEGNLQTIETLSQGDGQDHHSIVSKFVIRGLDGHPACTGGVAFDITERIQAEDALRSAQAQLRLHAAALEAAPNAISLSETDSDGTIVWVNPAFTRLTGYSTEEAIGKTHHILSSGMQDEAFYRYLWETIKRGQVWRGELVNRRKDGTLYYEEMGITPLCDEHGKITHFLAVKQDISARKCAEEALRKSEEHYRTLFSAIDEGFCIIEVIFDHNQKPIDYRFLETNPSFERQTGLINARGRTMRELAPRHEDYWFEIYGKIATTGQPARFQRRAEQLHRWYDVYAFRFGQPEKRQVAILFNDITDRKHAEAEVTALNQRLASDLEDMNRLHQLSTRFLGQEDLHTLLDAALDTAIAIARADKGNIQLLDETQEELGIATQRGFDPAFVEFFSHIRSGNAACGTAMKNRQCVIVQDIERSPVFLALPRGQELMRAAGVRALVCTPLLCRSGRLVGVLSVHFTTPHHPAERELHLLDLLVRQVADFIEWIQTDAALRAAKVELVRANVELERKVQERTASLKDMVAELEHFSYTITHDLRAPLRAMQSFGGLLLETCCDCGQPQRDYIQRITYSARRMDQLITDALDYSKILQQKLDLVPVNLGPLLRGLVQSYPQFQSSRAQIHFHENLPVVLGNEAALTQCFSNLLNNAIKFVKPGQLPHVEVWADYPPEANNPQPLTRNVKFVRIWIADHGIGISKDFQDRIFMMFQRVSKDYEGTGVGLALARKVVERMGGKIGVESEEGNGSRFWVELKLPT